MMRDVFDLNDIQAGNYLAIFSLVNMLGRLLYPILSDVVSAANISRKWLFVWLLGSQFVVTALMTPIMTNQLLGVFVIFTIFIISGMSGSLGTLPSLLVEMFGSKSFLGYEPSLGLMGTNVLGVIQTHGQNTGVEDHLLYIPFFVFIPVLLAICLVSAVSLRPYKFQDDVLPTTSSEAKNEEETKADGEIEVTISNQEEVDGDAEIKISGDKGTKSDDDVSISKQEEVDGDAEIKISGDEGTTSDDDVSISKQEELDGDAEIKISGDEGAKSDDEIEVTIKNEDHVDSSEEV
ncbi:hypothetical protein GEMRC1_003032 [Eukaryota sp. GEM-RC1]